MCLVLTKFKAPPATLHVDGFVGWVKSILSQFIAKRVLEDECRRDSRIEMTMLSVDRVRYQLQPWGRAKAIIEAALVRYEKEESDTGEQDAFIFNVPTILQQIENGIAAFKGSEETNGTVKMFRGLIQGRDRVYTACFHAETIIATLASCHSMTDLEGREGGQELAQVCQVSHLKDPQHRLTCCRRL